MPDTPAQHEYWMHHALRLADRALPQDVPVGAVLLDAQGQIISEGWNERELHHDISAHAELVALRRAGESRRNWRLTDCTLYVTLEPCPMCASALYQARLSRLVYGTADPVQGAMGSWISLPQYYPQPMQVIGGILEADCREQLQDFFKTRRQ